MIGDLMLRFAVFVTAAPAVASIALSYEILKANPLAWGMDKPALQLIVPCRALTWEEDRCCRRKHVADLTDADIESQFEGCFERSSADEIRYALETCCDGYEGIKRTYDMFSEYVELATCLTSSPSSTSNYSVIFACETSFLLSVLKMYTDLPRPLKKHFRKQHMEISKRSLPSNLVGPLGSKDFALRYALRILENLLLPPPVTSLDDDGMPVRWRMVEEWGIAKFHAKLSRKLRENRENLVLPEPEQMPTASAASSSPVVHLAIIASVGQPPYGRHALATLRSALFHAKRHKLHFHIFVDKAGWTDVEEAMDHLDVWLKQRIATVDYYGPTSMKKFWPVLKRYVPQRCISYHGGYGWLSWMRLFPQEVHWKADVEDLIWVDAGDYLFFADPALLLDEHKNSIKKKEGAMVSHPKGDYYNLAFNLPKMRDAKWTQIVGRFLGLEFRTNRSGGYDGLCNTAELFVNGAFIRNHPDLYATLRGEWMHFPRLPFYNGGLQRQGDLRRGKSLGPKELQMWQDREHPGMIDGTRAFVFCPTFIDWFAHFMVVLQPPLSPVEIAQGLQLFLVETAALLDFGYYPESPNYGHQHFYCGRPILGMHLIRQFHTEMPWCRRLLDFWSNVTGLWGGEQRDGLPHSLSEVE